MFDEIVKLVKDHFGNNQEITAAIPAGKAEEVHNEIATHVAQGLQSQAASAGGSGGLLSMLRNAAGSGSPVTSAIEGGLISSLTSKFGLPPLVTGAIAGALPGLLQKFAHKADDPGDNSITQDSINNSLSNHAGGIPGGLFNR